MDDAVFKRFCKYVAIPNEDGCMVWTGSVSSGGYGRIGIGNRKSASSNKLVYEHFVGAVSDVLELDHLCRNLRCVNPQHLEAVTHRENVRRGNGIAAKFAMRTHCDNGHEFTLNNTANMKDGSRICRACAREYYHAHK